MTIKKKKQPKRDDPKIEVCYIDPNGKFTRVVCLELDRKAINGGSSLADAIKGDITTAGAVPREVTFPPQNLLWIRRRG